LSGDLDFSHEDIERASRYHRPLYLLFVVRLLLGAAVYSLLAWSWIGDRLFGLVDGLGWAGAAVLWAAIVVVVSALVGLPLDVWQLRHERMWEFSRETNATWAGDRLKGLAISLVLTAGIWAGAVGLGRAFPTWWVLPAAVALGLLTVFLSFVAPVVLEPLFNHFEPLADERLVAELRAIADKAEVPIQQVLVADASKRTTKSNAYVSGLGATRRVVVWDTLLEKAGEPELKLIVAHELGHRRERHPAKLTAIFVAAGAIGVLLLWAVVGTPEPRDLAVALLLFTGLELVGLPPLTALFRRYERQADRWSLELTDDLPAYEHTHISLARDNLGDLAPPRWAYVLLFTHPTAPERLAFGRALAGAR
jgi:Zn-dependent protease with chaperone function